MSCERFLKVNPKKLHEHKYKKQNYNDLASYRFPMEVTEIFSYKGKYNYPICPRCKISLEREYQSYCDRCGQALSWRKY